MLTTSSWRGLWILILMGCGHNWYYHYMYIILGQIFTAWLQTIQSENHTLLCMVDGNPQTVAEARGMFLWSTVMLALPHSLTTDDVFKLCQVWINAHLDDLIFILSVPGLYEWYIVAQVAGCHASTRGNCLVLVSTAFFYFPNGKHCFVSADRQSFRDIGCDIRLCTIIIP